jgi:TonB-linked SusC/RagA family outer membrane protein
MLYYCNNNLKFLTMKKIVLSTFIALMFSVFAFAQDRTITGTVSSKEDGLPLPGATIKVKGLAKLSGITDMDGKFSLKIPANGITLEVSSLGYATASIAIGSNNVVNVSLTSKSNSLEEVVITAGGIVRHKREQGYASTKIDAEKLTAGKATSVASALTGKVAGLQINAVNSGSNPNYRIVFRGNRSLSGNNQALIVVDNVIVPGAVLGTINPEDIENVVALNSASGAALYGSEASNGALLITTKKGKRNTAPVIKVAHTYAIENVNFFPKLQNKFGSGTDPNTGNNQTYVPFENQQYGPAFDGSLKPIGKPLSDGSIQTIPYSARTDKFDFWDQAESNQIDFSISTGDEKSTMFMSAQYIDGTGTTPKDVYSRLTTRLNGSKQFTNKFSSTYSFSYTERSNNFANNTAAIYDNLLNTSSQIPLLNYKDWQNDPFANPNGYFNEYSENPYWSIDNSRSETKNNYLTGSVDFIYKALKGLDLTYRIGITNGNSYGKSRTNGFTYSDYTHEISPSKQNSSGSVSDFSDFEGQFSSDFIANYKTDIKSFSLNLIGGLNSKTNSRKLLSANGTGLQVDGLYNLSNITGKPNAFEFNSLQRRYGIYLDATVGYKKFAFLHLTGRNDWDSRLNKKNRSFFYPAADFSFIATEAIPSIKSSKYLSYLKVRAGVSQVGLVNLGAYQTAPTFGSITGYTSGTFFGQSSGLISPDLKPEITLGAEAGVDFRLWDDIIEGSVTFYKTETTNQVISTTVSGTTGFTSFLTNAGQLDNTGYETKLTVSPIRTKDWEVVVGGNYSYNDNKLVALTPDLSKAAVSGSSSIFGIVGQSFPLVFGTDYARDDKGRVIVDRLTGNPGPAAESKILGNTAPKHILGLNMAISWKNFSLSSVFEYRGGYVQFQGAGSSFDFSGTSARSAYYNRERFVMPNSSYLDPVSNTYVANNNITVSDGGSGFWTNAKINRDINSNYVYSGNYWKWRELSLAYDLPASFLKQTFVTGAKLSVQGRNLFMWVPKSNEFTDPDYSANGTSNALGVTNLSQAPPTRFIGATLSLTF